VEITAFCAIVTTINNDDTKRSYHPQQKEDNKRDRVEDDRPDDFVRVKNSLQISDKDMFSMMAKLDPANPQNNPEVSTSYLEFEKRESDIFD
jgi:hypothetical protein